MRETMSDAVLRWRAAELRAAWEAGRDAAAAEVADRADDENGIEFAVIAIRALAPPADLSDALAAHTERAVQEERDAIAAWLDSRREVYEARAIEAVEGDDQTDMMAAACYETASNFVRARGTP